MAGGIRLPRNFQAGRRLRAGRKKVIAFVFILVSLSRSVKLPKWCSSLALMQRVVDAIQPRPELGDSALGSMRALERGLYSRGRSSVTGRRSPSTLQLPA